MRVCGEFVKYISDSPDRDPCREIAPALFSHRFDLKSRCCVGDLEAREAWFPNYKNHYIGEPQVADSLDIQGLLVDVEFA